MNWRCSIRGLLPYTCASRAATSNESMISGSGITWEIFQGRNPLDDQVGWVTCELDLLDWSDYSAVVVEFLLVSLKYNSD